MEACRQVKRTIVLLLYLPQLLETSLLSLESLKSWQDHQSYNNADPALRKKCVNLLLMQRIHDMEMAAATRSTGNAIAPVVYSVHQLQLEITLSLHHKRKPMVVQLLKLPLMRVNHHLVKFLLLNIMILLVMSPTAV